MIFNYFKHRKELSYFESLIEKIEICDCNIASYMSSIADEIKTPFNDNGFELNRLKELLEWEKYKRNKWSTILNDFLSK